MEVDGSEGANAASQMFLPSQLPGHKERTGGWVGESGGCKKRNIRNRMSYFG